MIIKNSTQEQGKKRSVCHLCELGMNAIRLRAWADPSDGWCNQADVLAKAERAHKLGIQLMIDFHYSDSWADLGKQTKPVAWGAFSLEELKNGH